MNPKQRAILKVFRATGSLRAASRASGVSRDRHYTWMRTDPAYVQAFEQARLDAGELLVDEAWRRAVEGTPEVVVSMGKMVLDEDGQPLIARRHSDSLLQLLLRSYQPERFKEKTAVEHTGLPAPVAMTKNFAQLVLMDPEASELANRLLERVADMDPATPHTPSLRGLEVNQTHKAVNSTEAAGEAESGGVIRPGENRYQAQGPADA